MGGALEARKINASGGTLRARGVGELEKDGKVAESEVPKEGRSDIPALNSAMEETLKNIPAMDKPVPPHLVKLLTEMGVCFRLKTK